MAAKTCAQRYSILTTLILTHPSGLGHDTGPHHPERPERLSAIAAALDASRFARLLREEAPGLNREALLRVHPVRFVDGVEAATPERGRILLDADTVMSPGTFEAIAHCVGAAAAATDKVMRGEVKNAFLAMRPPGHHAGMTTVMGFCFFNTAAIIARQARAVHGAERVAIVDFDVHHGNGTQEIFWSDPNVLYASTHQMPLFPGTGGRDECGEYHNVVNVPLRAGDDGEIFREAIEEILLPRISSFGPDLIVISAGFDAHRHDPLGGLKLIESDFAFLTEQLMAIAELHAKGRIVSVLEGGYDLDGLARSVAAHVGALMGA